MARGNLELDDAAKVLESWLSARKPMSFIKRWYREDEAEIVAKSCLTWLRQYCRTWIDAHFDHRKWPFRDQMLNDTREVQQLLLGRKGERPYVQRLYGRQRQLSEAEAIDLSQYQGPDEETAEDASQSFNDLLAEYEFEGRRLASGIFLRFITGSDYWDALGRCKRCGRDYFNLSGQARKIYCSQKCASKNSAERATRQRFQEKRTQKLARLHSAIARFEAESTKKSAEDWQHRVLKLVNKGHLEEPITLTFLTRAINAGDVKPPRRSSGKQLREEGKGRSGP